MFQVFFFLILIIFLFSQKVGAGAQKSGRAAALPAPPPPRSLLKWKSSLAELLSCYHHWCLTRNSSKATDVIFLDLSKAFDRVPHERRLLKLNRHGIDAPLLVWCINSLKNRQQRVTIRGTYSNWSPVTPGNNPRAHLVLTQPK